MKDLNISPKISVIIPTYNRINELQKLLFSLIEQNLDKDKFEIIVVDDGSTDNTQELVKELQNKNRNINYLRIKNSGRSVARNIGASIAKSNIIAFVDSDCIADKNWLSEILLEFSKNPNLLVVRGPILSELPNLPPFIHSCIYDENLATGVFAIKKNFFDQIGKFDQILSYYAEDTELWIRIKKYTNQICYSNKIKIYHPPKYLGYSITKNFKSSVCWKLELYISSKHPKEFKLIKQTSIFFIKVLIKISIILIILFSPLNIYIIYKILIIWLIFALISLRRIFYINKEIIEKKSDIKIKFIDKLKYLLFGWLSDFISIITLGKAILSKK